MINPGPGILIHTFNPPPKKVKKKEWVEFDYVSTNEL